MRVAIAGLHHETNTFSSTPADLAAFEASGIRRGDEIIGTYATSHHTVAGFLRACAAERVDVVPLVHASVWPCGTITAEAFEHIADDIVDGVRRQGPFDVVLLAQHGAAVSEGHPDADGELAARVRSVVGPDVTVAMALDLHGNVTERQVESVDLIVGYRENPHGDAADRGAECATLALRRARGEVRVVQRLIRMPMIVPILGGWTAQGAMSDVMAEAERVAVRRALLSYTVFHGFGYADVPQMGSAVLAVADGDVATADAAARDLAQALWTRRGAFADDALDPKDAVRRADEDADGAEPVVLLDVGDNIGGGSPGDSTVLLAVAMDLNVEGFVATLCDRRAVQAAVAAGLGAEVQLSLGATTSVSVGPSLQVTGRVAAVTDGRFEDLHSTHAGFRYYDGGPTVRVSTTQGQELVISSRPIPGLSPEQLRAAGVEPREQRVIVAKGVVAPRAGYGRVTTRFIVADTPGVTGADLSCLRYRSRPTPLWPFEHDAALGSHAA